MAQTEPSQQQNQEKRTAMGLDRKQSDGWLQLVGLVLHAQETAPDGDNKDRDYEFLCVHVTLAIPFSHVKREMNKQTYKSTPQKQ